MTWQPACSSLRAQIILFSSSNRAFNSTSTVTCLPFSAAAARDAMIGEWLLTRYKVCLIARTFGSFEACLTKSTTGSKVSYGWCRRTSWSRIWSNRWSSPFSHLAGCGVYFGVRSLSYPSNPDNFIRNVKSKGPLILKISSSLIFNSWRSFLSRRLSMPSSTSKRIACPHWRFLSCRSISIRRSAASSSSMLRSALRMIRYGNTDSIS